jgi:hypothetical protein
MGVPSEAWPMIWPEESLPPQRPSSIWTNCKARWAYATRAGLVSCVAGRSMVMFIKTAPAISPPLMPVYLAFYHA